MHRRLSATGATIALIALALACGRGAVTEGVGTPITPGDTTKPPGTVQRTSLTVRVSVDPTDAALAAIAGVNGVGITVHLTRAAAGFPEQAGVTGSDGTVKFDALLDGIYTVSADRILSAAELARLSPGDRDASVFAGAADVAVSPPASATKSIALVANRRGSIIISEIFSFNSPPTTSTAYGFGTYLEVYNNADTTAYLDGVLLMHTPFPAHFAQLPGFPCTGYPQSLRLDTTSIIGVVVYAFPGSGREYPILPGQAKVVAMDAIDHRSAAPGQQQVDLSRADFEEIGSAADTDNPYSANMVSVFGPAGFFGRGIPFLGAPFMWTLLAPQARTEARVVAYPTNRLELGQTNDVLSFPARYRLDIVGLDYPPGANGVPVDGNERCVPWTAPAFDQAPAALVNELVPLGIARKSLGRTADGREILQRTRTSARDFLLAEPLRRSLNK